MNLQGESCPCKSGKNYRECCQPYHEGAPPENALLLMRSRYAAYARGLAEYIIATTHPTNPSWPTEHTQRTQEILQFSQKTIFENLKILSFVDGDVEAYVTFTAYLKQGAKDASFTEKSRFFKVNGRWLFAEGERSLPQ